LSLQVVTKDLEGSKDQLRNHLISSGNVNGLSEQLVGYLDESNQMVGEMRTIVDGLRDQDNQLANSIKVWG